MQVHAIGSHSWRHALPAVIFALVISPVIAVALVFGYEFASFVLAGLLVPVG